MRCAALLRLTGKSILLDLKTPKNAIFGAFTALYIMHKTEVIYFEFFVRYFSAEALDKSLGMSYTMLVNKNRNKTEIGLEKYLLLTGRY